MTKKRYRSDKDKEDYVEDIEIGEVTAVYFSEIESKIKSEDFRIENFIDPKLFNNLSKFFRKTASDL